MPSFVSLLQNRAEPGRRGSISQGAQTTEDQRRFFCQEHQPTTQPNQPNHPTIQLIHHSTHSFQDVANLLLRYLIQDLNHSWSFMGSQATCFFLHENGMCQGNHLYFPPGRHCLLGNSEVDNSEVSTIKSSHLLMRWLSVCCSKLLPYGATSKRLKPGKWYSNVIANSWFGLLTHISI